MKTISWFLKFNVEIWIFIQVWFQCMVVGNLSKKFPIISSSKTNIDFNSKIKDNNSGYFLSFYLHSVSYLPNKYRNKILVHGNSYVTVSLKFLL